MNLFASIPLPENFFPNISPDYRAVVRNRILIGDRHSSDIADSKSLIGDRHSSDIADSEKRIMSREKPHYKTSLSRPVRSINVGSAFSLVSFFSSANVTSLIRCIRYDRDRDDPRAANAIVGSYDSLFLEVSVEESFKKKKYVLLLCVFLPIEWSHDDAGELNRLSLLSCELLSSHPDFEIVLLAKMRKDDKYDDYYDEHTFNRFFDRAFPGRLAVPYYSDEAIDILCQKLGFDGGLKGVLVDNDKVRPTGRVVMDEVAFFVDAYSSINFPITYERLEYHDDSPPSDMSLAWLLQCAPSFRLRNVASSKCMSIKQINEKVVGLYLCQRGDKLTTLHEVHHQCRLKGLDFEVIIVCMPFLKYVDPYVFQDELFSLANKLKLDISSWWVVPFHTSACVRLWHLAKIQYSGLDAMIVLGPNCSYVDPYGGDIAKYFGVSAYPFIREEIVNQYVTKAQEVTLQSLLGCEYVDHLVEPGGRQLPLTYLHHKNVLLYVEYPPWRMKTYEMFMVWYATFKKSHARSAFELVLVSNEEDIHPLIKWPPRGLAPLRYISSSEHSEFLQSHEAFFKEVWLDEVKTGVDSPAVIAFRKDGHINMLNALEYLIPYGPMEDPFNPECTNLGNEVILMMAESLEFMEGYEDEAGVAQ